jgi:hypothetical protein
MMPHHVFKQAEFAGQKIDRTPAAGHGACQKIKLQRSTLSVVSRISSGRLSKASNLPSNFLTATSCAASMLFVAGLRQLRARQGRIVVTDHEINSCKTRSIDY